jgi:hypothetical protein
MKNSSPICWGTISRIRRPPPLASRVGHHVQRSTGCPSHISNATVNTLDTIETSHLVDESISACNLSTLNVTCPQGLELWPADHYYKYASTSMGCSKAREVPLRQNACLSCCRCFLCRLGILKCPSTALKAPRAAALHRQWFIPDQHIRGSTYRRGYLLSCKHVRGYY